MTSIPAASHHFRRLFEGDDTRTFRITLRHEDTFRLRCFCIVDPSIYGIPDQWCADVVEAIPGRNPRFVQLFKSGSKVDFVESEITEIVDESSGTSVFKRANVAQFRTP